MKVVNKAFPISVSAYFNCLVQGNGGKNIRVFGIEGESHDIMAMPFKGGNLLPSTFPVPQFNGQIVGRGKQEGTGRMNGKRANIIRMSRELSNSFKSVVIEDPNDQIIRTTNNPILSGNKFSGADWKKNQRWN